MRLSKNTRQRIVSIVGLVLRIGLGCLFLYSSLPKIRQSYDFLSDVYNYELVGPRLGMLVAITLPWLELVAGICLLGGIFVGGALLACTGMAAMFTFVIGWSLYQGLEISCGCFGSGTEKITYLTLIRAILILVVSMGTYALLALQASLSVGPIKMSHHATSPRSV